MRSLTHLQRFFKQADNVFICIFLKIFVLQSLGHHRVVIFGPPIEAIDASGYRGLVGFSAGAEFANPMRCCLTSPLIKLDITLGRAWNRPIGRNTRALA